MILRIVYVFAFVSLISVIGFSQSTPVEKYGQLRVIGNNICAEDGTPVALKGMSTMGLQWYGEIVNPDAFNALAKDWKIDVIRLAFYIGENGYASKPELKALVRKGIDLAIKQGIYVIVDWHVLIPGNPNDPVYSGAGDFFMEIAEDYGKAPNVIYEIMNEPNGMLSWKRDIKPYAKKMVSLIRRIDPDNIILIGSGTWSQDVDIAALDPVAGNNLAYTFHFYAGTHGEFLRAKVKLALGRGVAVFCSEWGTSEADGNGGVFLDQSRVWLSFLDKMNIGWVNWSLCSKNETSAAFKSFIKDKNDNVIQKQTPLVPESVGNEGYKLWNVEELSASGEFVRSKLRGE